MLTKPTVLQALLASLAVSIPRSFHGHIITVPTIPPTHPLTHRKTLTTASPTTPFPDIDICAIPSFQWHVNSESICCPGVVDMPQGDRSKAYCCVGAHIPSNVIITTTQTSCATTVSLNPITEYSSKAREAATKYGVTYTRNVVVGNWKLRRGRLVLLRRLRVGV
jgi:hypothetical protein